MEMTRSLEMSLRAGGSKSVSNSVAAGCYLFPSPASQGGEELLLAPLQKNSLQCGGAQGGGVQARVEPRTRPSHCEHIGVVRQPGRHVRQHQPHLEFTIPFSTQRAAQNWTVEIFHTCLPWQKKGRAAAPVPHSADK